MKNLLNQLQNNDPEILQLVSSLIASGIKLQMEIEAIDNKTITKAQVNKLMPIIFRNIYNTFFALNTYETDINAERLIKGYIHSIPDEWTEPELYSFFSKQGDAVKKSIGVQQCAYDQLSDFLKEQFDLKNIYLNEKWGSIEIKGSFALKGVNAEGRKKLQQKIAYHLKKNGFIYSWTIDGYIKYKL